MMKLDLANELQLWRIKLNCEHAKKGAAERINICANLTFVSGC